MLSLTPLPQLMTEPAPIVIHGIVDELAKKETLSSTITPEAMTTLQTQGIARITEVLDADETAWDTAIKFAKLSVKEIYEPLVAAQIEAALQNAADEYAIPAYYAIIVEIKNN